MFIELVDYKNQKYFSYIKGFILLKNGIKMILNIGDVVIQNNTCNYKSMTIFKEKLEYKWNFLKDETIFGTIYYSPYGIYNPKDIKDFNTNITWEELYNCLKAIQIK